MSTLTFRVRKPVRWDGKDYEKGDLVEIDEGHPRLRAMIEQAHFFEYASQDAGDPKPKVDVHIG